MRTVAIANQKGGCGKTTTAVNLAASLATAGMRTLLIDLDPQGHATLGFGFVPDKMEKTIYNAIAANFNRGAKARSSIFHTIIGTGIKNLSIIGANILLSGGELELAQYDDREFVLRDLLGAVAEGYDICVIDCSPSLSLLTINALVAATDVIVPVQAHYYALEGLKQLLETIDIISDRYNPELQSLGIVLTFIDEKAALSRQIEKQMRSYFGELVFDCVIRNNIRLAEAPSAGKPIILYDPESIGSEDYKALAHEVIYGKPHINYSRNDSDGEGLEQVTTDEQSDKSGEKVTAQV